MALLGNKTPQTPQEASRVESKPDPKIVDPKLVKAEEDAKLAKAAEDAKVAKAEADEIDFIGAPILLSPELTKETAPQNARNARQVKMDETIKKLHEAWITSGRPSTWGNAVSAKVVATYFMDPTKSADLKKLVTKAGRFLGVTIRWGTSFQATADLVKKHNLPEQYTGREVLSFFVKDTRPRANGTAATAATSSATTASPDQPKGK